MIFKLLVVDDEVTMRKGISNYMNWASIDCQVVGNASDGVEAMEFLDREPVDIVITDIKMPAADGLEVARYVYEHHPHTKVIILTGYADFQYAQTAIKYRVTSFILKPTNKKELFAAVQEAQKQLIISQRQENIAKEGVFFLKDQLMQELLSYAKAREDVHTIVSVITEGNETSVRLHEKYGFLHCGCIHEVGVKFGKPLGIVNMELIV